MPHRVRPGKPFPLGVDVDSGGTNFALFSESAERVELCLFDAAGTEERIPVTEVDAGIWHAHIATVGPGQRYGYRVDGAWDPASGRRSNPAKLLLDPYALALDGPLVWTGTDADEALFDYRWNDGSRSTLDSAPRMPKCVVVDRDFPWNDDVRPRRALADTVVYEAHVRALTMQHPDVPQSDRGTYRGFTHPAVLSHLRGLGVTAIELMPVQQFFDDRGTTNFWGYQPAAPFAPHGAYSASGYGQKQVDEFKTMVQTLHANGFDVIVDVVFNHTVEGGNPGGEHPGPPWAVGPTVCLRGVDNRSYYLLEDADPLRYVNQSGAGNTLNVWDPAALGLIMDALRYWVTDMHVDGFRFDEAAVLAQTDAAHPISVFLDLIAQDPVLRTVTLIAEPWFGDGEPQLLGRFPPLWCQWNGDFRWALRDFWRSAGRLEQTSDGLMGSPQIFDAASGERPTASVNYAACHDGLTVRDAVSYTDDGQHAWDCVDAGQDPADPAVELLRRRMQRNLLATAVLAQGVPMLLYGDECGRTQNGCSNAYDIDSPVTWMPWGTDQDSDLLAYTRDLLKLRRDHPAFRRPRFFRPGRSGVRFLRPDGTALGEQERLAATGPCAAAMVLDGREPVGVDTDGDPVHDTHSFLLLLNAGWEDVEFTVPADEGGAWQVAFATDADTHPGPGPVTTIVRPGRSLVVLTAPVASPSGADDGPDTRS